MARLLVEHSSLTITPVPFTICNEMQLLSLELGALHVCSSLFSNSETLHQA